ncbi:MAG TPA: hypothetical protein VH165_31970 [Kofleriaceae bacterium]|jgi:hypothetical protein|nr:hypothetical protein [Kofleriaceae bacterium]
MSKRLAAVLSLALGGALATGCNFGNAAFNCANNDNANACNEKPGGLCETSSGRCKYPDMTCGEDGYRYGSLAGGSSNTCVGGDSTGGPDSGIGVGNGDIDSGTPVDPPVCYGDGSLVGKICFAAAPNQPLPIDTVTTIDTGSSPMCATPISGGTGYCVVLATNIVMTSTLRGTGAKPLVLIASDSITSTGNALIDVSSKRSGATELGAGYDPASCKTSAGVAPTNSGGGAGGSFTGLGGVGGDNTGQNKGAGGTPGDPATTPITELRGGCPGQSGQGSANTGGHGGGAVFLIAGTKIGLDGEINAGGEGGLGGTLGNGGGGGGGAGGMIGFFAPTIMATNAIIANGGGGGEGGGIAKGDDGDDVTGTDPSSGGSGVNGTGGDGGAGAAGSAAGPGAAGKSGSSTGGGGGGGAGLIKAPMGANLGTSVSPTATP